MSEKFADMLKESIETYWDIWLGEKKGMSEQCLRVIQNAKKKSHASQKTIHEITSRIEWLCTLDKMIYEGQKDLAWELNTFVNTTINKIVKNIVWEEVENELLLKENENNLIQEVRALYRPSAIKPSRIILRAYSGKITTPFQPKIDALVKSVDGKTSPDPYQVDDTLVFFTSKGELTELMMITARGNQDVLIATNKHREYVIIYSRARKGVNRLSGIIGIGVLPNRYSLHGAVHKIKQLGLPLGPKEQKTFAHLKKLARNFS